jgi:signal transduction histidine kinase
MLGQAAADGRQTAAHGTQSSADGAQAAADGTGTADYSLEACIAADPGLAWWIHCQAARTWEGPLTAGRLADWFSKRARGLLTWQGDGLPAAGLENLVQQCGPLASTAVRTGLLARRLLQPEDSVGDEAYLLGLLAGSADWPILLGTPVAEPPSAIQAVPLSTLVALPLGESRAAAAAKQASSIVAGGDATGAAPDNGMADIAESDAAGARWMETVAGAGRLLPRLAARLAHLDCLEQDFQRQLETEKLEAMAELAAGAGHEINNPLAIIAGRAQLFLQSERDPERRRELAVINAQAMRVYEMIADMMLFARPPRPRPADCNLPDLIGSVVAGLSAKAESRQIELAYDRGSGSDVSDIVIVADGEQLTVALRALCENALAAVGQGGRVAIGARRLAEHQPGRLDICQANGNPAMAAHARVEITVEDNGPGFAPEVRRHAFDPFYSGRGAGRGLGMGLSKCWRIVRNHGGRIAIESQPGRGACLIVELPVC